MVRGSPHDANGRAAQITIVLVVKTARESSRSPIQSQAHSSPAGNNRLPRPLFINNTDLVMFFVNPSVLAEQGAVATAKRGAGAEKGAGLRGGGAPAWQGRRRGSRRNRLPFVRESA